LLPKGCIDHVVNLISKHFHNWVKEWGKRKKLSFLLPPSDSYYNIVHYICTTLAQELGRRFLKDDFIDYVSSSLLKQISFFRVSPTR
jgi:hypothetical protein